MVVPASDSDALGKAPGPSYLGYMEEVIDAWFVAALGPAYRDQFQPMARQVDVNWAAPARPGDVLGFALDVPRWGPDAFDVRISGWVRGRKVVDATITYGAEGPFPVRVKHALAAALMGL